ncbi:MAG: hypothetical protein ACE14V_13335, partial [bacterium]
MQIKNLIYKMIIMLSICIGLLAVSGYAVSLKQNVIAPQVFLKSEDIPGYTLKSGSDFAQTWVTTINGKQREIYYYLVVYDSPTEAILETSGITHNWVYGSFSGPVLGDHSWVNVSPQSIAEKSGSEDKDIYMVFVKNNVGVRAAVRGVMELEKPLVSQIVQKMINKIEKIAQPEIKEMIERVRSTQLSEVEMTEIIQEPIKPILSGYSMITQADSIWASDNNTMVLGRRYESIDTAGNFIGIDIVKYGSKEEAIKAGQDRKQFAGRAYWQDDISKPISRLPTFWDNSGSIIFTKNNYVIHIYQYNV